MYYISEKISSLFISHRSAYDAVGRALISAARQTGHIYPAIACDHSDTKLEYTIKAGKAEQYKLTGLKVGSYAPDNEKTGMPRHGTFIILVDENTGKLKALIQASKVNGYRTAASNAIATAELSRQDSRTLAIIGAGSQAYYEATALSHIRALSQILVSSRSAESAEKLTARLRAVNLPAEVCSIEKACRMADIITTVTTATSPVLKTEWIKPGTHISAMGSDATGKQELPTELLLKSSLFADYPTQSLEIGEYQHLTDAVIDITAIGDVLVGAKVGRSNNEEITIYDSSGIALQDLFVALDIFSKATKENLGLVLPG